MVRPQERRIHVFDSLGGGARADAVAATLLRWLGDEWADKQPPGVAWDPAAWEPRAAPPPGPVPGQDNGFDCGVFTLMFADCAALGAHPAPEGGVAQRHMPLLRRRVALAALQGALPLPPLGGGQGAG